MIALKLAGILGIAALGVLGFLGVFFFVRESWRLFRGTDELLGRNVFWGFYCVGGALFFAAATMGIVSLGWLVVTGAIP